MKKRGDRLVITCDELEWIRTALCMNRTQMADLCGVNYRTYHYWETIEVSANVSRFIQLLTYRGAVETLREIAQKEQQAMNKEKKRQLEFQKREKQKERERQIQ